MKTNTTLYRLTSCALMAALLCALGPLSVPIGPIPVSLATLVIYLSVYLLGMKWAAVSCLIYLLLGAVGIPVFSGFQGGLAKLVGPTGGYLVGYLPMALIAGFLMEKMNRKPVPAILAMIVGTAVLYLLGTIWFVIQTGSGIGHALAVCVYPFIPMDLGKIVLSVIFGAVLRNALAKAGLLPD